MPEDEILTPEDVVRLFKIPRGTQASMRHRRVIPYFNLSKRLPRYRRSELEAWLASKAVGILIGAR
jgi:hypothetical protein